tara:strand:- start:29 stop:220 length:192 start_codon:yes stop_codon:yes gene_type:complete
MEKITMIWGTEAVKGIEKPEDGHTRKTYTFNTEAEKKAFLLGVSECDGWDDYTTADELEYWGS